MTWELQTTPIKELMQKLDALSGKLDQIIDNLDKPYAAAIMHTSVDHDAWVDCWKKYFNNQENLSPSNILRE